MALAVGPGAPYITPAVLLSAATGIAWNTIPDMESTLEQQTAEQLNICMRATAMVDKFCNTPLRATIDTETVHGPEDYRFTVARNGVARVILSRPPVVAVLSGRYSPTASFPSQWTTLDASKFKVEDPIMGVYGTTAPSASADGGQAILVAPGLALGPRRSVELEVTYMNGWPHTQVTVAAAEGDSALQVDDVTGWLGATGTVKDLNGQEAVTVTAVSPSGAGASGPGTLTLSAPLAYAHAAGTLVTTLPGQVEQAAILFATWQALTRGGTSVTAQAMPGAAQGGGTGGVDSYKTDAEKLLAELRRVI
jgi:hypothetical protein